MSVNVALKLVKSNSFYRKELGLENVSAKSETSIEAHSLHSLVGFGEHVDPDLAAYLVNSFTSQGQAVLDPFCSFGTIALEVALRGRIPVISDVNRLKLSVAQALLTPVDITDVTLALQMIPFTRPVNTKLHDRNFEPFYDIRTFCELYNLRATLRSDRSATAAFIKAVSLSMLHGQSSGYFSAYSPQHVALSPQEQQNLNQKRRQVPDYRPVMPRILRKTAAVLRDGIPSAFKKAVVQGGMRLADSRNLSFVPGASIDSVITAPPIGQRSFAVENHWLESWFLGVEEDKVMADGLYSENSIEAWLEFMNASLFEMARVLKPSGKALLVITENEQVEQEQNTNLLLNMIGKDLNQYFEPEGILFQEQAKQLIGSSRKPLEQQNRKYIGKALQVLVLRRR